MWNLYLEYGPIEEKDVINVGVSCNCCKADDIIGPVYRCSICHGYNLCINCKSNGKHSHMNKTCEIGILLCISHYVLIIVKKAFISFTYFLPL